MRISNCDLIKILNTYKNFEESRKFIGEVPSIYVVRIPFTYNIKDSLKTDEDIKKIVKKFSKIINKNKSLRVAEARNLEIDLTLEKGASIYKIDAYFSRILSELKLSEATKFRVVVNFGEEKLGRNNVRYLLDKTESINLLKLQQTIEKHNGTLFFNETKDPGILWTLNEVLKANECINDIAKTIQENDLSPFESLLYICTWAQKNIKYLYDYYGSYEIKNTIVSAINNKAITCVGFSQFVTAVVNALGIDYLQENKCLMNMGQIAVSIPTNEIFSPPLPNHAQSKHYLIDKKYDIDGELIADVNCGDMSGHYVWQLTNDITLVAKRPLSTFSMIDDNIADKSLQRYKIYDSDSMERSELNGKVITYRNAPSKFFESSRKNGKIARTLECKDISEAVWKHAYERIMPLVFPEAQAGDLIAPIIRHEQFEGIGVIPDIEKKKITKKIQNSIDDEHSL